MTSFFFWGGVKTYSDPSYIFSGVETPNHRIYTPADRRSMPDSSETKNCMICRRAVGSTQSTATDDQPMHTTTAKLCISLCRRKSTDVLPILLSYSPLPESRTSLFTHWLCGAYNCYSFVRLSFDVESKSNRMLQL